MSEYRYVSAFFARVETFPKRRSDNHSEMGIYVDTRQAGTEVLVFDMGIDE